jgi:hypothetical protein
MSASQRLHVLVVIAFALLSFGVRDRLRGKTRAVNVNRGIQEVRTECGDLFDERTSSPGVFHRRDKI